MAKATNVGSVGDALEKFSSRGSKQTFTNPNCWGEVCCHTGRFQLTFYPEG